MPTSDGWAPDGKGLPPEAADLIAQGVGGAVHLRVTSPSGEYHRGACGSGLGEWWTGLAAEVTCPTCRQETTQPGRHPAGTRTPSDPDPDTQTPGTTQNPTRTHAPHPTEPEQENRT